MLSDNEKDYIDALVTGHAETMGGEIAASVNSLGDVTEKCTDDLDHAIRRLADSITPNVAGNDDAAGCYVSSLTEAVMGTTKGLLEIAASIDRLAEAVENMNE